MGQPADWLNPPSGSAFQNRFHFLVDFTLRREIILPDLLFATSSRLRFSHHRFKSMFLRHARAARLAVAYLLFTVALAMVPRADIQETRFDEATTPTNEIVIQKAASWEYRRARTVFVPKIFAQLRKISVRTIVPVYAGQLTDSRRFLELFCSLLC